MEKLFPDQRDIHEVSESALKEMSDRHNGIKYGLPTGFPIFDEFMGGAFTRNRQILIAGRPGEGKTTLKNIFQIHLFKNSPEKQFVFIDFSFEMRSEEHFIKNLSTLSGLTTKQLKSINYKLTLEQWKLIEKHRDFIRQIKYYYHDIPLSSKAIVNRIAGYRDKYPDAEIVVSVDHMKLTRPNNTKDEIRKRVSEASSDLSFVKQKFGTLNLLVCQLNRDVESRDNLPTQYEPDLKNLAESGSLEEDADTVIMLHRPDRLTSLMSYDRNGNPSIEWWNQPGRSALGELRVLIKKNRYGDCGEHIYFKHDFSRNLIEEID